MCIRDSINDDMCQNTKTQYGIKVCTELALKMSTLMLGAVSYTHLDVYKRQDLNGITPIVVPSHVFVNQIHCYSPSMAFP